MPIHAPLQSVTDRVTARSATSRGQYMARMKAAQTKGPSRGHLSCSGQAHAFAASGEDQNELAIGIVATLASSLPLMTCFLRTNLLSTFRL